MQFDDDRQEDAQLRQADAQLRQADAQLRQADAQLREVLREWKAPAAPPALEQRVLRSRARPSAWWRFLLSGYIRVPVPVVCGLAVFLTVAAWRFVDRGPAPCSAQTSITPDRHFAAAPSPDICDRSASGMC